MSAVVIKAAFSIYILQSHRIRRTTQVQQVAVNHDSTVLYGSSSLQVTTALQNRFLIRLDYTMTQIYKKCTSASQWNLSNTIGTTQSVLVSEDILYVTVSKSVPRGSTVTLKHYNQLQARHLYAWLCFFRAGSSRLEEPEQALNGISTPMCEDWLWRSLIQPIYWFSCTPPMFGIGYEDQPTHSSQLLLLHFCRLKDRVALWRFPSKT